MSKRVLYALATSIAVFAATVGTRSQVPHDLAPGAPGKDAQWTSAGKEAVGASNTLESKVWFTLRGGVMDEVYYPTVDVANTQTLQFVIVGGSYSTRRVELESEDTEHRIEALDPQSLSFRQVNTAKTGGYVIRKTYTVDPERSTVLIEVEFDSPNRYPYDLYVYYDPSLNNSGMHDSAWTEDGALLASDADKASALVSSTGFDRQTNGYLGVSDEIGRAH